LEFFLIFEKLPGCPSGLAELAIRHQPLRTEEELSFREIIRRGPLGNGSKVPIDPRQSASKKIQRLATERRFGISQ